jgi:hypothetical protein
MGRGLAAFRHISLPAASTPGRLLNLLNYLPTHYFGIVNPFTTLSTTDPVRITASVLYLRMALNGTLAPIAHDDCFGFRHNELPAAAFFAFSIR